MTSNRSTAAGNKAMSYLDDTQGSYQFILEYSVDGIFQTTRRGELIFCNQALADLFGYDSPEDMIRSLSDVARSIYADPKDREAFVAELTLFGMVRHFEVRMKRKDDSLIWVNLNARAVMGEDSKPTQIIGTVNDITELKAAEAKARSRHERYKTLVNTAGSAIMFLDTQGRILEYNQEAETILGYSFAEANGQFLLSMIMPNHTAEEAAAVLENWLTGNTAHNLELEVSHKSGEKRYLLWNARPVLDDLTGQREGIICVAEDITERIMARQHMRFLAAHDYLTGLPNRMTLQEELDKAINRVSSGLSSGCALVLLDLDNFKDVNDTMGHLVGDQLLKKVADRLSQFIPGNSLVARLGGDEFAILLNDVDDVLNIARLCEALLQALKKRVTIDGNRLYTNASIGTTYLLYKDIAAESDASAYSLMQEADLALYRSKERGRGCYHAFETYMRDAFNERKALEDDLRLALEREEFELHYQPQVDLNNKHLFGVEALIRWRHSDGRLIPPGVFIPAAERIGLIDAIGNWVLEEACRQTRVWHDMGYGQFKVAVNLSAQQFLKGELTMKVLETLRCYSLPPKSLQLELTESAMISDPKNVGGQLSTLRMHGVQVALDDFGTGYSSLSYLRSLPVDVVKIDRSFVRKMNKYSQRQAIIRGIVSLSHDLGLSVTAEGVETEAEMISLANQGADRAQGYFFSKPLPEKELTSWLRARYQAAQ